MTKCKNYRKYKAIYKPTCNKGRGCVLCWKKYFDKNGFAVQAAAKFGV